MDSRGQGETLGVAAAQEDPCDTPSPSASLPSQEAGHDFFMSTANTASSASSVSDIEATSPSSLASNAARSNAAPEGQTDNAVAETTRTPEMDRYATEPAAGATADVSELAACKGLRADSPPRRSLSTEETSSPQGNASFPLGIKGPTSQVKTEIASPALVAMEDASSTTSKHPVRPVSSSGGLDINTDTDPSPGGHDTLSASVIQNGIPRSPKRERRYVVHVARWSPEGQMGAVAAILHEESAWRRLRVLMRVARCCSSLRSFKPWIGRSKRAGAVEPLVAEQLRVLGAMLEEVDAAGGGRVAAVVHDVALCCQLNGTRQLPNGDAVGSGRKGPPASHPFLSKTIFDWNRFAGVVIGADDENEIASAIMLARCCAEPPTVSTLAWNQSNTSFDTTIGRTAARRKSSAIPHRSANGSMSAKERDIMSSWSGGGISCGPSIPVSNDEGRAALPNPAMQSATPSSSNTVQGGSNSTGATDPTLTHADTSGPSDAEESRSKRRAPGEDKDAGGEKRQAVEDIIEKPQVVSFPMSN